MTTCYAQPYAPAAEQKGPSLVGDQQPASLYVHLLQKGFAPTAAGETARGFLFGCNFLFLRRPRRQRGMREGADTFDLSLSQSASSFLTRGIAENEVGPT